MTTATKEKLAVRLGKVEKFFERNQKVIMIVCMVLLCAVSLMGNNEEVDAAAANKYIEGIKSILKYALGLTGGGIGLFGGVGLAMAYLQSNPSAYGEAIKKIVAGGMILGIAVSIDFFLPNTIDNVKSGK